MGWSPKPTTSVTTHFGLARSPRMERSAFRGSSRSSPAKFLGVCPATGYRLCEQGRLPHFRVLNAIRVSPRPVKRFLSKARR
jgi:hypothetical protein